ncbi:MAG TPA: DUF4340 domain-containing protein [Bacteroidetes bacterium]|nr:DUF4340 domain-containing protein [Bacteroidota bacterium]
MNNKILLIVLVSLLAFFGYSKFFSGKNDSSFNPEIIKINPDQVTKVVIQTKADNFEKAVLEKTGDGWTISKNGKTYTAAQSAVNNFLTNLRSVNTSYIAAKNADKWATYELEPDKATHITVYNGGNVLADFYIGKFSVNQQAQQITSFFRLADKDDIYAVTGMAGMTLGQGSNSYRDKQLLKMEINDIETLNYEGDEVYQVSKSGSEWLLNEMETLDSTKVKNFLMNLISMSGESFVDGFDENLNSDKLLKKLTINGSNMLQPITVRCWKDDSLKKPFIIQSSQYPGSYFESDSTRLFKRIFKSVAEW